MFNDSAAENVDEGETVRDLSERSRGNWRRRLLDNAAFRWMSPRTGAKQSYLQSMLSNIPLTCTTRVQCGSKAVIYVTRVNTLTN
jgi:hypothetical protein